MDWWLVRLVGLGSVGVGLTELVADGVGVAGGYPGSPI